MYLDSALVSFQIQSCRLIQVAMISSWQVATAILSRQNLCTAALKSNSCG
jgi:hypothetical protein